MTLLRHLSRCFATLAALMLALPAATQGSAPADKPVKVYILAGQSNMVGIGTVNTSGRRWGEEMIDPVLSVYEGDYDADKNYDQLEPIKTEKVEKFGGVNPDYFKHDGVQIVRGKVKMDTTGVYEFRPGYGGSTYNIMVVGDTEVYRKEPGDKHAEHHPIKLEAGETVDFKITYLTDDARGLGWTARVDYPGTLNTAVKLKGKHTHLLDDGGNWAVRDDVYYKGVVTATADKWLTVGCGAGKGKIGPELGFGWVLGNHHDAPVLLLKASQGNRSLAWDFCPPGSERFEHDGTIYAGYKDRDSSWPKGEEPETPDHNWYAGKQYDDCFNAAKDVLKNFDQSFPHWQGRGYEVAGFVWWQGHKDSGSEAYRQRYEQNLVHLINTLRKEFDAPDAPFVVGTVGFHGEKMKSDPKFANYLAIANAQLAVDDDQTYPQFKDNVLTVDTRPYWRPADESPKNQDFHYHQNGVTYYEIGEAFGKGMLELLGEE